MTENEMIKERINIRKICSFIEKEVAKIDSKVDNFCIERGLTIEELNNLKQFKRDFALKRKYLKVLESANEYIDQLDKHLKK